MSPEFVRPFSNGSEADCWEARNCDRCALNGYRRGKEPCELEEAISMGRITGTIPSVIAAEYGAEIRVGKYGGFCDLPAQCPKFIERNDDDDRDDNPEPPQPRPVVHDPRQLVLIADPTEDAARLKPPAHQPAEALCVVSSLSDPSPDA